ncbi:MAG: hypothetical protein U0840_01595 [Gemmataceae bacterium]
MGQFGITLQNTSVDVKITVADKARIRVLPKNEFDDKGNIVPFKIDKKDPDWHLGGTRGERKDIEVGTWVMVNLRRNVAGSVHQANTVIVLGQEEATSSPPARSKKK